MGAGLPHSSPGTVKPCETSTEGLAWLQNWPLGTSEKGTALGSVSGACSLLYLLKTETVTNFCFQEDKFPNQKK